MMQCLGLRKSSTCARGDRRRAAACTWNASARDTHPPCKGRSATTKKQTPQRRACSFFVFLLKSAHAAPPPLVIDMRARNVLMMREVFDAWRHENFRHWPPAVTDLSILQDHLDVWHAWMQWVRLATGLGSANARRMGLMLRTTLCEMLGCDWLGL